MKKLIAIIISFVMIFEVIPVSLASAENDSAEFERRTKILTTLKIIRETKEKGENVTRAQAIDTAVRSIRKSVPVKNGKCGYTDVLPGHKYIDSLAAAFDTALLSGNNENKIFPDENIKTETLLRLYIHILGYDAYYDWTKKDAYGISADLKLTKDADVTKEYIDFENFVNIAFNALEIPILQVTSIADGNVKVDTDRDVTLLSEYLDIYEDTGFVYANGYTSIRGKSTAEEGFVIIENYKFRAGESLAEDYVGEYVKYYYRENRSAQNEILYVENDDQYDVLEIADEDIDGYDDFTLTYTKSGREKTANISPSADIIYNGKALGAGEYDESLFDVNRGNIKLIKANSNVYGIVKITSYQTFMADSIYSDERQIRLIPEDDAYNSVLLEKDNNSYIKTFENGAQINIESVKAPVVVSSAASLDGKCARIEIFKNTVPDLEVKEVGEDEISVQQYDYDAHEYKNVTYEISKEYQNVIKSKPLDLKNLGKRELWLDNNGRVIYIKSNTDNSDFWAYIASATPDEKSRNNPKVKLFKQTGRFLECPVAERVTVDGKSIKRADFEKSKLYKNGEIIKQIAFVSLNYDGEIRVIDTCLEQTAEREADYSLYKKVGENGREAENTVYKMGGLAYNKNDYQYGIPYFGGGSGTFKNGILMSGDTVIFAIPACDDPEDEDYMLYSRSYFEKDCYYLTEGYSRDDSDYSAQVVVYKYYPEYTGKIENSVLTGKDPSNQRPVLQRPFARTQSLLNGYVEKITKAVKNGDDGVNIYITDLSNGITTAYFMENESYISDVDEGDIIRYYLFNGEKLRYTEKLFSTDNMEFDQTPNILAYNSAGTTPTIKSFAITNNRCVLEDSFSTSSTDGFDAMYCLYYGGVADYNAQYAYIKTKYALDNGNDDIYTAEVMSRTSNVFKYGKKNKKLEKCSFDDIKTYKVWGAEYSKIAVVSNYRWVSAIIVFN